MKLEEKSNDEMAKDSVVVSDVQPGEKTVSFKMPRISKKLTVFVVYAALVVLNKKYGIGLTETEILSIAGVAATYLGSQGIVDYGKG